MQYIIGSFRNMFTGSSIKDALYESEGIKIPLIIIAVAALLPSFVMSFQIHLALRFSSFNYLGFLGLALRMTAVSLLSFAVMFGLLILWQKLKNQEIEINVYLSLTSIIALVVSLFQLMTIFIGALPWTSIAYFFTAMIIYRYSIEEYKEASMLYPLVLITVWHLTEALVLSRIVGGSIIGNPLLSLFGQ